MDAVGICGDAGRTVHHGGRLNGPVPQGKGVNIHADHLCRVGHSPGPLCRGVHPGRLRLSGEPGKAECAEE